MVFLLRVFPLLLLLLLLVLVLLLGGGGKAWRGKGQGIRDKG